jgi:hypothetical protein
MSGCRPEPPPRSTGRRWRRLRRPFPPRPFAPRQPDGRRSMGRRRRRLAAGRQPGGGGGAPSLPSLRSPAAGGQPVNGAAVAAAAPLLSPAGGGSRTAAAAAALRSPAAAEGQPGAGAGAIIRVLPSRFIIGEAEGGPITSLFLRGSSTRVFLMKLSSPAAGRAAGG